MKQAWEKAWAGRKSDPERMKRKRMGNQSDIGETGASMGHLAVTGIPLSL